MDCPWTVHGLSMDSPWTVHGLSMDSPWTVRGLSMDCPLSMDSPWYRSEAQTKTTKQKQRFLSGVGEGGSDPFGEKQKKIIKN